MRYMLTIPPAFAEDRTGRDLSNGEGEWVKGGYATIMSQDEFDDLKSDAQHYANGGLDFGDAETRKSFVGLISSARATINRCEKARKIP